jgi:uncharacterized membrane protein
MTGKQLNRNIGVMMKKVYASLKNWLWRRIWSFSSVGLLFAGLLFAASLTPSLVPRSPLFQGVLAGICIALGYGIGNFLTWLWHYIELPATNEKLIKILRLISTVVVVIIAIYFLWRGTLWQNSIRELMEMSPVVNSQPVNIAVIALIIGWVLIEFGRLVGYSSRLVYQQLIRIIPRRIAGITSAFIVGLLLVNLMNGVVAKYALRVMDSSYQAIDKFIDDGIKPPIIASRSGSSKSLINWNDLGKQGREFVVSGASIEQLSKFSGKQAKQPIRVFVGLNSAATVKKRAKLAVAEMKRVRAFDRKVLVVVTPTGTGWIDPMASNPFEYLHNGDTALVALQYSYLASYLSLMAEPERAQRSARALFKEIYTHWRKLPKNSRPKLYLHGLSLGSLGSESSAQLYELLDDPIHGALWSGPPFANNIWRSVTNDRNEGTPAWLPEFRDGSLIRFTSQINKLANPTAPWGPMRIVYLQYASDPIVFFDTASAFSRPAWMLGERGPDVSPKFTWYPIVTFIQLLLDMATAISPPLGYGHTYAPGHYIDGWIAVTDPDGWTSDDTFRLKKIFADAKKRD